MSMTLTQLRDEIRAYLVRSSNDPIATDARLNTLINQAIIEAAERWTFHSMRQERDIELGAGEYRVDLPANTLGVNKVRVLLTASLATDLTGYVLYPKPKAWATRRYLNLAALAARRPEATWIDRGENRLYFAPKLNAAYTMRTDLIIAPTTMVNDGDDQPFQFGDEYVIAKVVSKLFKIYQQYSESREWAVDAERAFLSMKNSDVTLHGTSQAPDREGYDGNTGAGYDANDPFQQRGL